MQSKLLLFLSSLYLLNKARKQTKFQFKLPSQNDLQYKLSLFKANLFASNTLLCNELSRPYFGCSIRATEQGVGMLVVLVKSDSPAETAGIRVKDVIIEIEGKSINSIHDYNGAVGSEKGKKKVKFIRKVENIEKIFEVSVEFIK